MSKRFWSKLDITDKDLAADALRLAGCDFHIERDDCIYVTSGEFSGALLNLGTGAISGDSDLGHTEEKFGLLRQYYSEAEIRRQYAKDGTTIEEKSIEQNGDVVLMWQTGTG